MDAAVVPQLSSFCIMSAQSGPIEMVEFQRSLGKGAMSSPSTLGAYLSASTSWGADVDPLTSWPPGLLHRGAPQVPYPAQQLLYMRH